MVFSVNFWIRNKESHVGYHIVLVSFEGLDIQLKPNLTDRETDRQMDEHLEVYLLSDNQQSLLRSCSH